MVDGNSPPSTRVRAAERILNHSSKALEMEDIDARLPQLSSTDINQRAAVENGAKKK